MSEALRKAAEQALFFMVAHQKTWNSTTFETLIDALRAALTEPEQSEPYIYYDPDTGETWTVGAIKDGCRHVDGLIAIYTTPPRREPLSDAEIVNAFCEAPHQRQYVSVFADGVRFAEKHYGITGEKT